MGGSRSPGNHNGSHGTKLHVKKHNCRFGIPRMISNIRRQFDSQGFRSFCSNISIKNQFSSPGHPQANGQTKVTNRTLLKIIKARLEGPKGARPKELPKFLWAYRTTARTPIGETLFRLTYGMKAIIPIEVGVTSMRREFFEVEGNDEEIKTNLDFLDEVRVEASQRIARYQQKMANYYTQRVRLRRFNIGDLIQ